MHPIRIGTCGWSYKDWSGAFYPSDLPASGYLSHYAERYPVVEVDSTFYRSPSRRMVEGWRDRTPDGFGFSLKVPQAITHEKMLTDCRDEVRMFLTAARVLGDKAAVLPASVRVLQPQQVPHVGRLPGALRPVP
jgi:uncharacterized protein YecE (DUF72 family)